ncbi:MAG: RecX family transcriptional regulator [Clostridia bacterium]
MVITHTEVQKKNQCRVSVFIDGRYAFGIDEEDWFKLNLYVGQEITEQEIDRINEQCNYSKAKKLAVKYILYKKRTSFEVHQKLEQSGFDAYIAERVIEEMERLAYIDDRDYVCKYIKYAVTFKKYGQYRIRLELQQKGIDEKIISAQLDEFELDERSVLEPLVRKKIASYTCNDEKSLNNIKNYFIRKGYPFEMINQVINDIIRECRN